jgi:hypothetical protein
MEILQLIISFPKWLTLLVPRVLVAVLNCFSCPWGRVCYEETFFNYNDFFSREEPVSYKVLAIDTVQLGHWLVAYLRGYYKKQVLYCVKESLSGPMNLYRKLNVSSGMRRAVHQDRIPEIVSDCKILSR